MAKVSRHEVSIRGTSGAIFWFLTAASVVCAIGLATPAWWAKGSQTEGLWQYCTCSETKNGYYNTDWFKSVQAMMVIGGGALIIATLLAMIYQFCHCCDMNCTLIVAGLMALLAVAANIVGLVLYAVKMKDQKGDPFFHYSYGFEAAGTVFAFVATLLCFIQYCKSN